jgi:hypothetical protein
MASYKRIGGNYTIESIGGNVTIVGNLVVTGNSTSVTSTNTSVTDSIITLNKGESGSGVTSVYSGIEIDRGSAANVQLRWNEDYDKWQITSDGTTFSNISTVSAGGGLTLVANLDMTNYSLYSSTNGNVRFDDNVAIQNTTVAPPASTGYNTVYAQTPGGGGSGLYVTNTTTAAQELATQAAAIKYSIIFG